MATNYQIGIITRLDKKCGYVWTLGVVREHVFINPCDWCDKIQVGSWVKFCLRNNSVTIIEKIQPLLRTGLNSVDDSDIPCVKIYTRLIFPPVEWADTHGYKHLVYSCDMGNVGNYAMNGILEENCENIKPCVAYEGFICRIPFAKDLDQFIERFGTIWVLPRQKLYEVQDYDAVNHCPWNRSLDTPSLNVCHGDAGNLARKIEALVHGKSTNEKSCLSSEKASSIKDLDVFPVRTLDIEQVVNRSGNLNEIAFDHVSGETGLLPPSSVGVVVRCCAEYYILWSKLHGCILVPLGDHFKNSLDLELGQWVRYSCCEDSTAISGIKYSAYTCVPTKMAEECFIGRDNRIMCYTTISESQSSNDCGRLLDKYVNYESESLGVIPLRKQTALVLKNLGTAIEASFSFPCIVVMSEDPKDEYPWQLFKVKRNLDYIEITELEKNAASGQKPLRLADAFKPEGLVFSKPLSLANPLESKATVSLDQEKEQSDLSEHYVPNGSVISTPKDIKLGEEVLRDASIFSNCLGNDLSGAHGSKDVDECFIPDTTHSKKSLPRTIFVGKKGAYGIIWTPRIGAIAVRPEHVGMLNPGIWVRADIIRTKSKDSEFRYVTVSRLIKIEDVLPLRKNGETIQVQVTMEADGREEKIDNKSYLVRRSEVGDVYVPQEKTRNDNRQKRMRAWATFSMNKYWIISDSENLWEVNGEEGLIQSKSGFIDHLCMRSTSIKAEESTSNEHEEVSGRGGTTDLLNNIAESIQKPLISFEDEKLPGDLLSLGADEIQKTCDIKASFLSEKKISFLSALKSILLDEDIKDMAKQKGLSRERDFLLNQINDDLIPQHIAEGNVLMKMAFAR